MGPVYYPFHDAIKENERKLIFNNLKNDNGIYTIDFEKFEEELDPLTKKLGQNISSLDSQN